MLGGKPPNQSNRGRGLRPRLTVNIVPSWNYVDTHFPRTCLDVVPLGKQSGLRTFRPGYRASTALYFQQIPPRLSQKRTVDAFAGRFRIPIPMLQLQSVSPMLVHKVRSNSAPQGARRTVLARKADPTICSFARGQFSLHDRWQPPGPTDPAGPQMAH